MVFVGSTIANFWWRIVELLYILCRCYFFLSWLFLLDPRQLASELGLISSFFLSLYTRHGYLFSMLSLSLLANLLTCNGTSTMKYDFCHYTPFISFWLNYCFRSNKLLQEKCILSIHVSSIHEQHALFSFFKYMWSCVNSCIQFCWLLIKLVCIIRKEKRQILLQDIQLQWNCLIHTTHVFVMVLSIFRCWRCELANFIEIGCPAAKFDKKKMLNSGSRSIKFEWCCWL